MSGNKESCGVYPVLFRIPVGKPLEAGGVAIPLFGLGMLLAVWTLLGLWEAYRHISVPAQSRTPILSWLVPWGIIAIVIYRLPGWIEAIPINSYGLMMAIGFLTGGWWAIQRARQVGMVDDVIWDLLVWLLVGGVLGARSFYVVQYRDDVFRGARTIPEYLFAAVNVSSGGLVLYGGLLVGAVAYFVFCQRRNLKPLELADVVMPSVFLGVGFGRLGCLLFGCCYGDRCTLPWAISFPADSPPFTAMVLTGFLNPGATSTPPLHPTQIYSSIDGFLLAALTAAFFPLRKKNGDVLAVGLLIYPITRFLIEFVRGDEQLQFNTGFTISQLISLGILILGVGFFVYQNLRQGEPARILNTSTAGMRSAPLNPAAPKET